MWIISTALRSRRKRDENPSYLTKFSSVMGCRDKRGAALAFSFCLTHRIESRQTLTIVLVKVDDMEDFDLIDGVVVDQNDEVDALIIVLRMLRKFDQVQGKSLPTHKDKDHS